METSHLSNSTETQWVFTSTKGICAANFKKVTFIAIGVIVALGGVFLFLAAWNILPDAINDIASLGIGGKVMAGIISAGGVVGILYGIFCKSQSPVQLGRRENPSIAIQKNVDTKFKEKIQRETGQFEEVELYRICAMDDKTIYAIQTGQLPGLNEITEIRAGWQELLSNDLPSVLAFIRFLEQKVVVDLEKYKRLSIFLSLPARKKILQRTWQILQNEASPEQSLEAFYTQLIEFFGNFKFIENGTPGSIFVRSNNLFKDSGGLAVLTIKHYNDYSLKELQALLFVLSDLNPLDRLIFAGKNILLDVDKQKLLEDFEIRDGSTVHVSPPQLKMSKFR